MSENKKIEINIKEETELFAETNLIKLNEEKSERIESGIIELNSVVSGNFVSGKVVYESKNERIRKNLMTLERCIMSLPEDSNVI